MNIVSHWMLEASNVTCGDFQHNESEWEAANLTPVPSVMVGRNMDLSLMLGINRLMCHDAQG